MLKPMFPYLFLKEFDEFFHCDVYEFAKHHRVSFPLVLLKVLNHLHLFIQVFGVLHLFQMLLVQNDLLHSSMIVKGSQFGKSIECLALTIIGSMSPEISLNFLKGMVLFMNSHVLILLKNDVSERKSHHLLEH